MPNALRDAVAAGRTAMGIEFGSTRIKACLVGPDLAPIATGSYAWENQYADGFWTYGLDELWTGAQAAVDALLVDVEQQVGIRPTTVGAIGVSAMMHGYLAFGTHDDLLVPFRTLRNSTTQAAATQLTDRLGFNIPLRWSVAHYVQAMLDHEPHVAQVRHLTTLAGYVHWRLTGQQVLGVGDASGMFPIDRATGTYDTDKIAALDGLLRQHRAEDGTKASDSFVDLLPCVLPAGRGAGHLTEEGARLLDPTGTLQDGIPLCPPEGDAGTGMVATNAVTPRTGNVSVGTSIFAMVVLESALRRVHPEIDVVATPAGDPVAMVHCNNGANEIDAWARLFFQFAVASGLPLAEDEVFAVLLRKALEADAGAGGLLAYNNLSGEPVTGLSEGRPLVVRSPGSPLTLANFMRAQVYGAFAALRLGMDMLAAEEVGVDTLVAHGGLFRTEGVAQRFLAAALGTPIAVGHAAGEGGAWGGALLAAYLQAAHTHDLSTFLDTRVFADAAQQIAHPHPDDEAGFADYLERYQSGLAIQRAAVSALPPQTSAEPEETLP